MSAYVGREGALGEDARQHRLHAVVAQREGIGRALGQGLEQHLAVDAVGARDGQRLGQRHAGLEQDHVVQDLDRLAAARLAAIGHLARHVAQQRLDAGEAVGGAADHDGERAVDRGLPRARHRRVGEGRCLALELGIEPARQVDRRGAEVDHRPAQHGLGDEAAFAQADLLDLLAARQREKDRAAARGDLVERGALHAVAGQPLERRLVAVGREHFQAALARQVAAHRLAHGADADKSDHVRHVSPR